VSRLRRRSDAILVGTGTVIEDNPELIPHDGVELPNPIRCVMGMRNIPPHSHVLDDRAELIHIQSHNFEDLISRLLARGIKSVMVESGSELGSAMLSAGLIDEIIVFQAPSLLGSGRNFMGDLGITTLAERQNLTLLDLRQIGSDIMAHLKVGE